DPAKHSLGRRINPIGWNDVARESQAARAVGVPGIRVVDAPCYARYIAIGSSRYRRCEVGVAGRIENPVGISDGHSATRELTPFRRLPVRKEEKFVLLDWAADGAAILVQDILGLADTHRIESVERLERVVGVELEDAS